MGLDASSVGIIKQFVWNDTDQEMREIVDVSISGFQGDRAQGTVFDAKPIEAVMERIVLIAHTFGHPAGLFKDSIEKICSVVIMTQRIESWNGMPKSGWTSHTVRSLLPSWKGADRPLHEQLLSSIVPSEAQLPRVPVSCYRIACDDSHKMAKVEDVTEIALERVIGKAPVSNPHGSNSDGSQGGSQGLDLHLSQEGSQDRSPMDL